MSKGHKYPQEKYIIEEEEDEQNAHNFESEDLEFDEYGTDLRSEFYEDENEDDIAKFCTGRMTPDGLIEDDFEAELGCAAQEMSVQDVIDADFQDISRLGILQLAGDDKLGRKVIVFSACRLPYVQEINHERLLEYIKKTLEQYVASDYTLVYFHFGFSSRNKPSVKWMLQAYKDFDRNFKKNLKNLYLVHPTGFIKFMWNLFRPFISVKFGRKVMYVNQLSELYDHFYIDQLPIPHRVKEYDDELKSRKLTNNEFQNVNKDGKQLTDIQRFNDYKIHNSMDSKFKMKQFGVSLDFILDHYKKPIPIVMEKCVTYLQILGIDTEGIFLRSVTAETIRRVKERFDKGEIVDFKDIGDPHVPAVILKIFLRQLKEPLLTFELYDDIVRLHNLPLKNKIVAIKRLIMDNLPQRNYDVLYYLITFLAEVAAHSSQNHMNAINLGMVFGSNLIWCSQLTSLSTMGYMNNFVQLLINNYEDIFVK